MAQGEPSGRTRREAGLLHQLHPSRPGLGGVDRLQLEAERYTTVLQAWDFRPGENFVVRMRNALQQADRTIAVLSQAYLASRYGTDEWTGAFLRDNSDQDRLLPVRVEACELPRLLATRIYIDLAGMNRQTARARLLEGVRQGRLRLGWTTSRGAAGLAGTTTSRWSRSRTAF